MARNRQSIVYQTQQAFKELIKFSESKHSAKSAFLKEYSGSKAIDKFMAGFGKASGIFSYDTFKSYLSVGIDAARFGKENFGIKNIQNLTSEHIQSFLQDKINKNLAKSTIAGYCAALEKFGAALEKRFNQKYDFEIKNANFQGKENLQAKQRSGYHPYENPKAIVNQIKNMNIPESHKAAIQLTAETGLRLHKALTTAGIKVNVIDKTMTTQSKGGRQKEMNVSKEIFDKIANLANDKGVFKLDSKSYNSILSELEKAAKATGQSYEACHGFRHSFFLQKTSELQKEGMDLKTSWTTVSKSDMDHNRFVSAYTRG